MIHDQNCRCRACKPAATARRFSTVVPVHQPLPPHVRRMADAIVWAVLLLASCCTLALAIWGKA